MTIRSAAARMAARFSAACKAVIFSHWSIRTDVLIRWSSRDQAKRGFVPPESPRILRCRPEPTRDRSSIDSSLIGCGDEIRCDRRDISADELEPLAEHNLKLIGLKPLRLVLPVSAGAGMPHHISADVLVDASRPVRRGCCPRIGSSGYRDLCRADCAGCPSVRQASRPNSAMPHCRTEPRRAWPR